MAEGVPSGERLAASQAPYPARQPEQGQAVSITVPPQFSSAHSASPSPPAGGMPSMASDNASSLRSTSSRPSPRMEMVPKAKTIAAGASLSGRRIVSCTM